MKSIVVYIIIFFSLLCSAQQEFHVFPSDHLTSPGTASGNGSLQKPWDLQTALTQPTSNVNGGDTIWLHEGIYKGRFVSTINSTKANQFITVSGYRNDRVILDGNTNSKTNGVLIVTGNQVIYKNFEVTWLGEFSRNENDADFQESAGINHTSGEDCRFYNLQVYNNPGLGFGSWKQTGGSRIENCMIYGNGFVSRKGKGQGEGMYVQNTKDNERIIKDNIIFNNYYKGIEVWSAGRNAKFEYVKNITLDNNVIFNSGLPSEKQTVDNIIVGSDDRNGINIAKNITVKNNILYHNTDFQNHEINGDAASLTLGFYHKTPIENVVVDNNVIIGRNNALRILYAKSLTFTNNVIYSGYVHMNPSMYNHINEHWSFDNNLYYTKKSKAFRLNKTTGYNIKNWTSTFNIDVNSEWKSNKNFNLEQVLDISKNEHKANSFRVVLFDVNGNDINVDFTKQNVKEGMTYSIKDVEDYSNVISEGIVPNTLQIEFQMSALLSMPYKTPSNFGVYIIEFKDVKPEIEQAKTIFGRFFRWLGF